MKFDKNQVKLKFFGRTFLQQIKHNLTVNYSAYCKSLDLKKKTKIKLKQKTQRNKKNSLHGYGLSSKSH